MGADRTVVPAELVVCTPLRAEYAAARWGLRRARRPGLLGSGAGGVPPAPHVRLLRTGMGPGRSRRAAEALSARLATAGAPGASVVVAGVAGALTPELTAGDVVVADELLGAARPCPAARPDPGALAVALRAAGLSVHVGPVLSTARPGGDRERLAAATGAIAVDTESAFFAPALDPAGPPAVLPGPVGRFAVVRVVVDTPAAPLLHPKTVPNGMRALRVLARVAAALPAWAAAPSAGRTAPTGVR